MKKLNILYFFPTLALGGGQRTSTTLAKELKLRGHNIIFVSEKGVLLEDLIKGGVKHFYLPFNKFTPQLQQISFMSVQKLIHLVKEEKIDIIHTYHPYAFVVSYIVSIACNIPIINTHLHKAQGYKIPWFKGKVICAAEEFKDAVISKYPIDPDSIIVIRNRVDLQSYHPGIPTKELEERYALSPDDRKVVMMSRIEKGKHKAILNTLDAVINVAHKIPNLKFILAGEGDYFSAIEQKASAINKIIGRNTIIMAGGIKDTATLLNLADVVIGIGRCAWEGMACAKPTIIVGEKGFAGIVDQQSVNKLGYYNFAGRNITEPVQPEVLSQAIITILKDKKYAYNLGNFCQKFVMDEFDSKVGGEKLEKIYYQLIDDYEMKLSSKIIACFSINKILFNLYLIAITYRIMKKIS